MCNRRKKNLTQWYNIGITRHKTRARRRIGESLLFTCGDASEKNNGMKKKEIIIIMVTRRRRRRRHAVAARLMAAAHVL